MQIYIYNYLYIYIYIYIYTREREGGEEKRRSATTQMEKREDEKSPSGSNSVQVWSGRPQTPLAQPCETCRMSRKMPAHWNCICYALSSHSEAQALRQVVLPCVVACLPYSQWARGLRTRMRTQRPPLAQKFFPALVFCHARAPTKFKNHMNNAWKQTNFMNPVGPRPSDANTSANAQIPKNTWALCETCTNFVYPVGPRAQEPTGPHGVGGGGKSYGVQKLRNN